jgi:CHRD domain
MMKRLAIVTCLAAAVAVAGCGGDNNPSGPSNTTVFTVNLLPSLEVPPVSNAESSGRGTAVITVHSDSNTVDFNVSMTGFPNGTVIQAAHIHPGASGTTGSPVVNTGLTPGTAVTLANGSGTMTFNGVATTAQNVSSILAAPQNFYFNIHSPQNPGGVARGQLR